MIAAEGQLASAGVDWRYVTLDPIDSAVVLDPADAARQVVRELDGFHREVAPTSTAMSRRCSRSVTSRFPSGAVSR